MIAAGYTCISNITGGAFYRLIAFLASLNAVIRNVPWISYLTPRRRYASNANTNLPAWINFRLQFKMHDFT